MAEATATVTIGVVMVIVLRVIVIMVAISIIVVVVALRGDEIARFVEESLGEVDGKASHQVREDVFVDDVL